MTAPPIPISASGRGRPSSRASSSAIARERRVERLLGDDAVEAEALGERDRADVHAEALVDLPGRPNVNCELPPPVSKTASGPSATSSADVAAT